MKKETQPITAPLFNIARFAERVATYVQGKGYFTTSIRQENALVHKLLGKSPTLAIDIGGNIGEYSAEIRRRNPNAEDILLNLQQLTLKS